MKLYEIKLTVAAESMPHVRDLADDLAELVDLSKQFGLVMRVGVMMWRCMTTIPIPHFFAPHVSTKQWSTM